MKCWKILIVGLLLWVMAGPAYAAGWFGKSNPAGTVAADIENYIKGGIFYCTGEGDADSINVFLEVQLSSATVRCAIYERTSGAVWQLIDSSAERACAVGTGWFNFPLIERASLMEGTQYALVAWAGQSPNWNCRIRNLESQGEIADSMFFKSATYGAWPTPTTPTLVWYFDVVIVCYYSAATAPARSPVSIDEVVYRGAYVK
ncbi:hypothetical protein ACFLQW_03255 [Candidatus Zixiibacteriota bacterium]